MERFDLGELKIPQLVIPCRINVSKHCYEQQELIRTVPHYREAFKGRSTRIQHLLSSIPAKVLEFDRSKIHSFGKLLDQVRRPLQHSVDAGQSEVPAQEWIGISVNGERHIRAEV